MTKKKPSKQIHSVRSRLHKLWMPPNVHASRKKLPGKIRQRIKRQIEDLAYDPYPANSTPLRLSDSVVIDEWEVRRVRLDDWRIVYAVSKIWQEVGVLIIQKRLPY